MNVSAVPPKIANFSLIPVMPNADEVALQHPNIIAICNCVGYPLVAINCECTESFEAKFEWGRCDGNIAEIAETAQLYSTFRTRQPVPFGSQFRCVCNNSIGVPISHSALLILPSMRSTFLFLDHGCRRISLSHY